jgi:hypothetical protein
MAEAADVRLKFSMQYSTFPALGRLKSHSPISASPSLRYPARLLRAYLSKKLAQVLLFPVQNAFFHGLSNKQYP